MLSRRAFIPGAAFSAILGLALASCVTTRDSLTPLVLDRPVLAGWFLSDTPDPEWKDSRVGLGLEVYLAEAWYDVFAKPLAQPGARETEAIAAARRSGARVVTKEVQGLDAPILFGRIVRAELLKTKGSIGILHVGNSRYEVEVELSLFEPRTGLGERVHGFGSADRVSASAVLRESRQAMVLDDDAASQAARRAIANALGKLKNVIQIKLNP